MSVPGHGQEAEIFAHLLEVLLPEGGYVMAIYDVYLDESYSEGERILAIGGYLVRVDNAKLMDAEWRAVLAEYNLPYFHMADAHGDGKKGSGVFSHLNNDQCDQVVRKMIAIIKKYVTVGFAGLTNPQKEITRGGVVDMYTACLAETVDSLGAWMHHDPTGKVAFFFEAGHPNGLRAHKFIDEHYARGTWPAFAGIAFKNKAELPLLQSADLLVWQATKFLADKIANKRKPRKDFIELVQERHSFGYVLLEGESITDEFTQTPHIESGKIDAFIRMMFDLAQPSNVRTITISYRVGPIS
jgi:hypothetical protein